MAPNLSGTLTMAAIASMFSVPFTVERDRAWVDGRGTPHRKRHGKVAANRRKAKAARQARKR